MRSFVICFFVPCAPIYHALLSSIRSFLSCVQLLFWTLFSLCAPFDFALFYVMYLFVSYALFYSFLYILRPIINYASLYYTLFHDLRFILFAPLKSTLLYILPSFKLYALLHMLLHILHSTLPLRSYTLLPILHSLFSDAPFLGASLHHVLLYIHTFV